jgi:hypothetical protein
METPGVATAMDAGGEADVPRSTSQCSYNI